MLCEGQWSNPSQPLHSGIGRGPPEHNGRPSQIQSDPKENSRLKRNIFPILTPSAEDYQVQHVSEEPTLLTLTDKVKAYVFCFFLSRCAPCKNKKTARQRSGVTIAAPAFFLTNQKGHSDASLFSTGSQGHKYCACAG